MVFNTTPNHPISECFDIKSKKYGKMSLLCAKGLGRYFSEVVIKKNIAEKFRGINGKFGEIICNGARFSGKDLCVPEIVAENYKKEHPYHTENLEFFV